MKKETLLRAIKYVTAMDIAERELERERVYTADLPPFKRHTNNFVHRGITLIVGQAVFLSRVSGVDATIRLAKKIS